MIGLVTDSNSQLTIALQERFAVRVVPMPVLIEGHPRLEGVELDLGRTTGELGRSAVGRVPSAFISQI